MADLPGGAARPNVWPTIDDKPGPNTCRQLQARSLLGNPKVVLLDEPTAALGVAQTRQVLDLILRLKDRGLGVVVISHNLADVFEVTDRVIVLRLGRRVKDFDTKTANQEEVVGSITGVEFGEAANDAPDKQEEAR